MGINYTATESGGFSTSYFTALTLVTDGTTSTTENFTFAKVTDTATELVITKNGTELSVTVDSDAAAAIDVTAYEYTVQGKTYLAIFYVKNSELHFAVYNDELEVAEADNALTSEYTTVDGVHGIYSHEDNGAFIVDASSTSGSSGNYMLNYQITNSAPEFLTDVTGESLTTRPSTFTASDIGTDDDDDILTISAVSVSSENAICITDADGSFHVYYTGPTLADGATADVTLDVTLSDDEDTTNGTYTITFEGTGTSTLELSVDEVWALINAGYASLDSLGGEITGITLVDTLSAVTAMTSDEVWGCATAGVNVIDLTSSEGTLNKTQADVFIARGITFAGDDDLTLADTAETLGALTETEIESLAALGIDAIDATDNVLELGRAAFDALTDSGISLASGDTVTLIDTASALGDLTETEIATLAELGIDAVDASDDVLTLGRAAFDAFVDNGISLASDDSITLLDTGASLGALTESEIGSLAEAGIVSVDATDDVLELDRTAFDAFLANNITFATGDSITLIDTASSLGALAESDIEELAELGIDSVGSSDGVFELDRAAFDVFADNDIGFADESALRVLYTGTEKKDKLDGTDYVDVIRGLGKNDVLNGLAGNDELYGDDGVDTLNGGSGNDILRAGKGNDILKGGTGDDTLMGAEGNDKMSGGGGADVFVFMRQAGKDVITDFQSDDRIDLSDIGRFEKFSHVKANAQMDGDDLIITINPGAEVTLTGVSIKELDADNFIF